MYFQLYRYKCIINRIVDGDTIDVDIDLGYDIWIKNERVRLIDIDCPEVRTRDLVEKEFGFIASRRVAELLPEGSIGYLISEVYGRRGGFGRILGDFVIHDGVNNKLLTEILLEERHAVKWDSKNKALMEENHLNNRSWLIENEKLTDDELQRIRNLISGS